MWLCTNSALRRRFFTVFSTRCWNTIDRAADCSRIADCKRSWLQLSRVLSEAGVGATNTTLPSLPRLFLVAPVAPAVAPATTEAPETGNAASVVRLRLTMGRSNASFKPRDSTSTGLSSVRFLSFVVTNFTTPPTRIGAAGITISPKREEVLRDTPQATELTRSCSICMRISAVVLTSPKTLRFTLRLLFRALARLPAPASSTSLLSLPSPSSAPFAEADFWYFRMSFCPCSMWRWLRSSWASAAARVISCSKRSSSARSLAKRSR